MSSNLVLDLSEFNLRMVNRSEDKVYEFADFRLDAGHLMLYRGSEELELAPKAVETLLALVERRGEIVSKDELLQAVWPDAIVEESNLFLYLSVLRKTLGTQASGKPWVQTLRRRGYRFNGEVRNGGRDRITALADGRAPHREPREEAILPPVQQRQTQSRVFSTLLLVVAVLGLVGGGAWAYIFYRNEQKTEISLHAARFQHLTSSGSVYEGRISPDGKFVAYSQLDVGAQSLWLRQITAPYAVRMLSGSEWIHGVTFSRDGSFLYYLTSTTDTPVPTLYKIPVLGGEPRKLPHVTKSLFTFAPDGKRMAFYRHSSGDERAPVLTISNIDGTDERPIAPVGDAALSTQWYSAYLAWSPDGKTILVSMPDRASTLSRIGALEVATGELKYFTGDDWKTSGNFEWTADGGSVVVAGRNRTDRGSQLWQISYPDGEARQLTNDVNTYRGTGLSDNVDVMTTVVVRQSANIWTVPISAAGNAKQVTRGTSLNTDPAFTPDGKIVFTRGPIFVMDETGENLKQLTEFSSNSHLSISSSDFIVFTSHQKQRNRVYRMNMNGGGLRLLTDENEEAISPQISPDGQWVYYLALQNTNKSMPEILKKVAAEGGPSVAVLDTGLCDDHAISPDGKHLACNYSDTMDSDSNLAMIDLESGKPIRIFKGVYSTTNIRWSPDGLTILFGDNKDGATNIWAQPIDGNTSRQITNFTSDQIYGFDVSRDGKQLVLARGTRGSDVVVISDFR